MAKTRVRRLKGPLTIEELRDAWDLLSADERLEGFRALDRAGAENFFLGLRSIFKAQLLLSFPELERRTWVRFLPPDDVADVVQKIAPDGQEEFLDLLDEPTRKEVNALLAYAQDVAGGLMNPLFIRLRPDMQCDEAIRYVRQQTRARSGSIYYAYVLDLEQHLLGVVSFRHLLSAPPEEKVTDFMVKNPVSVTDTSDQKKVSDLFSQYKLMAIPVVDEENRMKGIVTLDDVLKVVQKEATKEIQKIGGSEALDEPYFQINFFKMIKKRAGWLTILFLGETLTTSAMGHYQDEMIKAALIAMFIPLIISSGGNSGSQGTTLIIRSMALREIRLRDWWRVFFREIATGFSLGIILASIGFTRIMIWPKSWQDFGPHKFWLALAVACSLVGVVLWGSLTGAMMPFILRKCRFDPASASAPFVATMVDVSGLVIYFTVASIILKGTML